MYYRPISKKQTTMAYTKLTQQEKDARKEARDAAKREEKFFDDLADGLMLNLPEWTWEEPLQGWDGCDDPGYTPGQVLWMVKAAYEAGKAAAS